MISRVWLNLTMSNHQIESSCDTFEKCSRNATVFKFSKFVRNFLNPEDDGSALFLLK